MNQKPFKVGNYNIGYIGENFQNHFGDMDFTIPETLDLKVKKLERSMTDKKILAEFKPKESTLGEMAYALENDICSKDGYANIFYIRDAENVLWAVSAYWDSGLRCWHVNASSVEDPSGWRGGIQVISCDWGVSEPASLDPLTLSESDSLKIIEIEWNNNRYRIVE